jgi:hypothetical protein
MRICDMDNETRQVSKLRFRAGLRPLVRKDRKCLMCGCGFPSDGAHHRLCDGCKCKASQIAVGAGE